ncbi:MAG: ABC transporter ATP-binding protein [Candidatus Woesearchaeota archaeon]
MIEVSGISKSYENLKAVNKLSFSVEEGEILAIIGPNGAGKSTALKMLCGLLEPDKGDIRLNGLRFSKDAQKIKESIGFVPEETAIYEGMNVMEYLVFFGEIYGLNKKETNMKARRILESLQLGEEHFNKPLGNMSKGMKRKVLIARSLINDPDILIYDEPVSGLDPHTANFLLNYILELKRDGKCILFSAHNLHHVEFVCDKIVVLHKGKVLLNDYLENVKKEFGEPKYVIKYKDFDSGKIRIKEFKNAKKLNKFMTESTNRERRIIDIRTEEKNLEQIFLRITE